MPGANKPNKPAAKGKVSAKASDPRAPPASKSSTSRPRIETQRKKQENEEKAANAKRAADKKARLEKNKKTKAQQKANEAEAAVLRDNPSATNAPVVVSQSDEIAQLKGTFRFLLVSFEIFIIS